MANYQIKVQVRTIDEYLEGMKQLGDDGDKPEPEIILTIDLEGRDMLYLPSETGFYFWKRENAEKVK